MNRITDGLRIYFSVVWYHAGGPTSAALCAKVKVMKAATDELLFANDCAVSAHSGKDIQLLTECFVYVTKHLSLAATLKKTHFLL